MTVVEGQIKHVETSKNKDENKTNKKCSIVQINIKVG